MPVTRSQPAYARFHQGVADVTDDVGIRSCFDKVSVLQQLFDCSIDLSPRGRPCPRGVRMRLRFIGGHLAILLKPGTRFLNRRVAGIRSQEPFFIREAVLAAKARPSRLSRGPSTVNVLIAPEAGNQSELGRLIASGY